MSAITRQQARTLGRAQYYAGQPCRNGHWSPRFTANAFCVACEAERLQDWAAICTRPVERPRMDTVISLDEAREQGLAHFFTGIPCRAGHLAPRHVSNDACLRCAAIRGKTRMDRIRAERRSRGEGCIM